MEKNTLPLPQLYNPNFMTREGRDKCGTRKNHHYTATTEEIEELETEVGEINHVKIESCSKKDSKKSEK